MIAYDQVKRELLEIAEAFPEKIYERPEDATSCLYVHTYTLKGEVGQVPGCIVGWWLNRYHGISLDSLAQVNDAPAYTLIAILNFKGLLDEVEPRGQKLLEVVQRDQDRGAPWGASVKFAIRFVENIPKL